MDGTIEARFHKSKYFTNQIGHRSFVIVPHEMSVKKVTANMMIAYYEFHDKAVIYHAPHALYTLSILSRLRSYAKPPNALPHADTPPCSHLRVAMLLQMRRLGSQACGLFVRLSSGKKIKHTSLDVCFIFLPAAIYPPRPLPAKYFRRIRA